MPGAIDPAAFAPDVNALASPTAAALIAKLGSAMLTSLPGSASSASLPVGIRPPGIDSAAAPTAVVPAQLKSLPSAVPLAGVGLLRLPMPSLPGPTALRLGPGDVGGAGVPYFLQDATGQAATIVPPAATPAAALGTRTPSTIGVGSMPSAGGTDLERMIAPALSAAASVLSGAGNPASVTSPFSSIHITSSQNCRTNSGRLRHCMLGPWSILPTAHWTAVRIIHSSSMRSSARSIFR